MSPRNATLTGYLAALLSLKVNFAIPLASVFTLITLLLNEKVISLFAKALPSMVFKVTLNVPCPLGAPVTVKEATS